MNFENIFVNYWKVALISFLLAFFLIFLAVRFFPKLKLLDRPQKYGLNRAPIPYYGGLAIFLSFIVLVFIFVPFSKAVLGLVLGASLIAIVGFFDDLLALSPFLRLFVQFLACLILIFFGIGILSINLPFFGVVEFTNVIWQNIYLMAAVFTVFWVMAIVNTLNFVDGVPGLTSGVSFFASLTLFFLSVNPLVNENLQSQSAMASIALIISMISLAFLIFDFPKPKILMGDTGSTFLGFVLATLAIFSGGKVATAFLVLGIPILDMVWVVFRRTFVEKKKFWHGDLKHLHHRLLDIGLSQRQVVILYLSITAILGFGAVILVNAQQKFFMLIALGIFMLLLAFSLLFLAKRKL